MTNHDALRSAPGPSTRPRSSAPSGSPETIVQLKRTLAGLDYGAQEEALAPASTSEPRAGVDARLPRLDRIQAAFESPATGEAVQRKAIQREPAADPGASAPSEAPAPAEPVSTVAPGEAPQADADAEDDADLTPIRRELLELFKQYEGKVVGDPAFEKIIPKGTWDETKAKEAADIEAAQKKYDEKMAAWNALSDDQKKDKAAHPKPRLEPVPKFTTCLATESALMKQAFEKLAQQDPTVAAKARVEGMGSSAKKNALAGMIVAHAGMAPDQRPQPGDVLILAFRGAQVDAAAGQNAGAQSELNKAQARTQEGSKAALAAAQQAAAAAQAAVDAWTRADGFVAKGNRAAALKAALTKVRLATAAAAAAAADTSGRAEKDVAKAQAAADKTSKDLENARATGPKYFQFSHIGFLKSRPVPHKDKDGKEDGLEVWETFDGGQWVTKVEAAGGHMEGAKTVTRTYDAKTNEIAGEAQQGGDARWLQGWINVDTLVQAKE